MKPIPQKPLPYIIIAFLSWPLSIAAHASLHFDHRSLAPAVEPGAEQATASFGFANTGEQPVTITSIKTSCGCTTAELDKKTYEPGEAGEIAAILTLGDRVGKHTKKIIVRTDDEASPVTTLTMKVSIPKLLRIQPRFVYWRADEELTPKTIRIEVTHDEPIEITAVKPSNEGVTAELKAIEPGQVYEVALTPGPTSTGSKTILHIKTNYPPDNPKTFTAMARVIRPQPQAVTIDLGEGCGDALNAAGESVVVEDWSVEP